MSLTSKIITSAVAGSVAGVVANFFVNSNKNARKESGRSIKKNEDIKFSIPKEDDHFFV
jgi:hypothetical protein